MTEPPAAGGSPSDPPAGSGWVSPGSPAQPTPPQPAAEAGTPAQPGVPAQGGAPATTPAQPAAGQMGSIVLEAKYHWLQFLFAAIQPKLIVNGYEVPARWGRNVVGVHPGQYRVEMYVPYFLPPRVGPATYLVTVDAGQTVALEYRLPLFNFADGSLGPPPQQWRGVLPNVIIAGAVLLVALCCMGLIVVNGLSSA